MKLKLYLISQNEVDGYDTYDSAVVCAATESDAKNMHPNGSLVSEVNDWCHTWCKSPESVKALLIGAAAPDVKAGVVLASFNAG